MIQILFFICFLRTKVRLGEHEIKNELIPTKDCSDHFPYECNRIYEDFEIENVTIHPGYGGRRNFNQHDIALIRLKTKVKRNG